MQAGKLDRMASFDYPVWETDAKYGRRIKRWDRLCTCRVNATDLLPSRDESVRNGLADVRSRTRFRLPYRGDIDATMRIVLHGGRDVVYQIIAEPAMLGHQEGLEIIAERYSTSGAAT